jgi:hypothetical protein
MSPDHQTCSNNPFGEFDFCQNVHCIVCFVNYQLSEEAAYSLPSLPVVALRHFFHEFIFSQCGTFLSAGLHTGSDLSPKRNSASPIFLYEHVGIRNRWTGNATRGRRKWKAAFLRRTFLNHATSKSVRPARGGRFLITEMKKVCDRLSYVPRRRFLYNVGMLMHESHFISHVICKLYSSSVIIIIILDYSVVIK